MSIKNLVKGRLSAPLLLAIFSIFYSVSLAAQVGTPVAIGNTEIVDAHGECRQVSNPSAGTRMVFTGTAPEWQSFRDNPNGLVITACVQNNCDHNTWTARASSQPWTNLAMSADGSRMIATANQVGIFLSTDAGATWTQKTSSNDNWQDINMTPDGMKGIVVFDLKNAIYTTSNGGETWVARSVPQKHWIAGDLSDDGQRMVAVFYDGFYASGGPIYLSNDSGATWAASSSGTQYWTDIAISGNGNVIVAAAYGSKLYVSTNGGSTWVARENSRNWQSVAVSTDGSRIVAAATNGKIYVSTDSGANWVESSSPSLSWSGVSMSSNGMNVAAVAHNDFVYVSSDGGLTWQSREAKRAWASIASSGDGSKLAAAVRSGQIYTSACAAASGAACGNDGLGAKVGGYCWYAGKDGESCTQTCASRGGVDMAGTRDYAGSGGTLANCKSLAQAMWGITESYNQNSNDSGMFNAMGCARIITQVNRYHLSPTTADASYPMMERACACNGAPAAAGVWDWLMESTAVEACSSDFTISGPCSPLGKKCIYDFGGGGGGMSMHMVCKLP